MLDILTGKEKIVFRRVRNLTRNVKGGKIARAVRPYHRRGHHEEDILRVVDKSRVHP
jgi:hypothetical protein